MGHEDSFLRYFNSAWRRNFWGYMPLYKKGERSVKAPVYIKDIVTGVVEALKNKHVHGQTYQCVGPHFYRLSVLLDYFFECTNFHEMERIELYHPMSWSIILLCCYMECLFLVRPVYTFEKWERENISDKVVSDYPTMDALLPKGYQVKSVPDIAPYELKWLRKSQYYIDKMEIPPPPPPKHLDFGCL